MQPRVSNARALPGSSASSTGSSSTGSEAHVVANRWRLVQRIGKGSFGEIYMATDVTTGGQVAIKVEALTANKHPQLLYESHVYDAIGTGFRVNHAGNQPVCGIPRIHWFGREGKCNLMVMDLLGRSLESLFNLRQRRFTPKTVLMLADQMLTRIQFVHSRCYVHRDIKPDNFVMGMGRGNSRIVYLVDFGLAKKYWDKTQDQHLAWRDRKSLTGTARYASINTHRGIEQSRRDDLESLGYVLMYFCRGQLPWQGFKASTKRAKYQMIMDKKRSTTVEQLCRGFPPEFSMYLQYVRALHFEEEPNYDYCRSLFLDLLTNSNYEYDYNFDWSANNAAVPGLSHVPAAPVAVPRMATARRLL